MSGKFWIALLIALSFTGMLYARENSETGVIRGRVVNGTDASIRYGGEKVDLLIFPRGGDMEQKEALTDADGGFSFTGLPLGADRVYMVSTRYLDVLYHSGRISLESESEAETTLTVYETTTTDDDIRIESEHIIIDRTPEGYRITQMLTINNSGKRTLVGRASGSSQKGETLYFPLPRGYTEFKVMRMLPQELIEMKADGFALTQPVPPGTLQANFTYLLPVFPRRWEKKVRYYTRSINVFNGDPGAKLTSDRLADKGAITFMSKEYGVLAGKELPAGSSFSLTFRRGWGGRVAGNLLRRNQGMFAALFIIGLGVLLGVSLALKVREKRRAEEAPSAEEMKRHKEELIEYIAALDQRFEEGGISEEEYQRVRREKKAQLLEVARMIEQGPERGAE